MKTSAAIGVLIALIVSNVGCVATSRIYKESIKRGMPTAIDELKAYNASHNWDANGDGSLSVEEENARFAELSDIEALGRAIKDPINSQSVLTAWSKIAPRYRWYIENDPALNEPDDKLIRLGLPNAVDEINARELERQEQARRAWFPQQQ